MYKIMFWSREGRYLKRKMALIILVFLMLTVSSPVVIAEPAEKTMECSSSGFDVKLKKLAEKEKMGRSLVETKPWTKFDPPDLGNVLNETERIEEQQALGNQSEATGMSDQIVYGDWKYTTMGELRGDVQNIHTIVDGDWQVYVGTQYAIGVIITMDPDENYVDRGVKRWIDDLKLVIELPYQDDVPEYNGIEVRVEQIGSGDKAFSLLIDLTAITVAASFPPSAAIYAALINAGAQITKTLAPVIFRAGISYSVNFDKGNYDTNPVSRLTFDLNDIIYSYQMPLRIIVRPRYNGGHGPKPIKVDLYAHQVTYQWEKGYPGYQYSYSYYACYLNYMMHPVFRTSSPDSDYYYRVQEFTFAEWVGGSPSTNSMNPRKHNYAFYRVTVPNGATQLDIHIAWNDASKDIDMELFRFQGGTGRPVYVTGRYGITNEEKISIPNPSADEYLLVIYGFNAGEIAPFEGYLRIVCPDWTLRGIKELPYRISDIASNGVTKYYNLDNFNLGVATNQVMVGLYWWDYDTTTNYDDLDLVARAPNGNYYYSSQFTRGGSGWHGHEGTSVYPSSGQFGRWQLQVRGYAVDSDQNAYIIGSNWIITK